MIKKSLIKLTAMTFAFNLAMASNSYSMSSAGCDESMLGSSFCSALSGADFSATGSSPFMLLSLNTDNTPQQQAQALIDSLPAAATFSQQSETELKNQFQNQNSNMTDLAFYGLFDNVDDKDWRLTSNSADQGNSMMYAQNDNMKSRYDAQTFFIGDKKINSRLSYSMTSGEQDRSSDVINGFDLDSNSLNIGLSSEIQKGLLVGIDISANQTEIDFDSNGERDQDSYDVRLSVVKKLKEKYFVNAALGYSMQENSSSRRNVIDNAGAIITNGSTVTADFDSTAYSFNLGGGMVHQYQDFAFIPALNLNYSNISIDEYSEKGTGLLVANDVRIDDVEVLEASVGVTALHKGYKFGNNVISPKASITYGHELINDGAESSFIFSGQAANDSRFVIAADDEKRSRLNLGLGVEAYNTNGFNLKFDYVNTQIEDYTAHTFMFMTGYQF